jgi:hypothetical protein
MVLFNNKKKDLVFVQFINQAEDKSNT